MPLPLNKHHNGSSQFITLAVLLLLCASIGVAVLQRQAIYDWVRLRNYHPPATVAQLADEDAMTAYSRKIFYVNQPSFEPKQTFFGHCPSGSREQTIVLGCYHGNQAGIFVLQVSDPRLDGVQQVTAAHEMLHAAYDRLSTGEKSAIIQQLQAYFDNGLTDNRIRKTIEAYKLTEPKDLVNEMHSIFGTEIAHLPANLEQYYSRYFTNRANVTDFANQYQSVFVSRQLAVASDDAELKRLKVLIDSSESSLKTQQQQIQMSKSNLDSLRSSNAITAYNAGVPEYNSLVDSYNRQASQLQTLINRYNQLVSDRNAIANQEDQLVNELQSNAQQLQQ